MLNLYNYVSSVDKCNSLSSLNLVISEVRGADLGTWVGSVVALCIASANFDNVDVSRKLCKDSPPKLIGGYGGKVAHCGDKSMKGARVETVGGGHAV